MRILTVTTSYPRHAGDWAGRFVRDLNAGLAGLGHRVETLAPWAPGLAFEESDPEAGGLRRVRIGARSAELFYGAGAEANARRLGPVRSLAAFRDASRAFEAAIAEAAARADLVLAHWVFPCAWWAVGARAGVPVLGVVHGADARFLARPLAGRVAARRLRRRLAGLVCVSARAREIVAPRLEVPADRVLVSPMGIDTSVFGAAPGAARDERLVAAAGRLVRAKGFDLLIEACAGLDARLVIAGDGPERDRLATLARGLGVRLELAGTLAADSVAALFRRAQLVVVPSRPRLDGCGEGAPLVAMEALACGAAVVGPATKCASLRDSIRRALADPGAWRDPNAAARFDRRVVAERVLLVAKKPASSA